MRYDVSTLRLSENLVEKTCQREGCGKTFYVKSRYADVTKWCSNNCLQIAYYNRRKNALEYMQEQQPIKEKEQGQENINLNTHDMDTMELLLKTKDELAETKTKLLLAERDLKDADKLMSQVSDLNNQISVFSANINGLKRDNAVLSNQLNVLQEDISEKKRKLSMATSQLEEERKLREQYNGTIEELTDDKIKLSEENEGLEEELRQLKEDREELVLSVLILRSKGLPNVNGAKINFSAIDQYLPDFEYKRVDEFNLIIWDWRLTHSKGSEEIIISKVN